MDSRFMSFINKVFVRRTIEGYIIETESLDKNYNHIFWDKWNRKVYKDLSTAIEAWNNIPDCYKNWRERFNVKCRIIPVYRGKTKCELDADGNIL